MFNKHDFTDNEGFLGIFSLTPKELKVIFLIFFEKSFLDFTCYQLDNPFKVKNILRIY